MKRRSDPDALGQVRDRKVRDLPKGEIAEEQFAVMSILQFNADGVGQSMAGVPYGVDRGFAPESRAFFASSHSLLVGLRGFIRAGGQVYDDAVPVPVQWLGDTSRNLVIDDAHKLVLKDELLRGSANLQRIE